MARMMRGRGSTDTNGAVYIEGLFRHGAAEVTELTRAALASALFDRYARPGTHTDTPSFWGPVLKDWLTETGDSRTKALLEGSKLDRVKKALTEPLIARLEEMTGHGRFGDQYVKDRKGRFQGRSKLLEILTGNCPQIFIENLIVVAEGHKTIKSEDFQARLAKLEKEPEKCRKLWQHLQDRHDAGYLVIAGHLKTLVQEVPSVRTARANSYTREVP